MTGKSLVLIRRAEYDGAISSVVEEIFERFPIALNGKRVVVKPNLLTARSPEKGVTTHPSLVAAVVRALERRGAAEILVGDNSGMTGYGDNEAVAAKTGILDAAGKHFRNFGRNPVRVPLHNPYASEVTISGDILGCDVLITLPRFKTHSLTMLTAAIKNSYGHLLGAEKARLHRVARNRQAFARTVVDVWALRKPDLAICDAVTAMQGNGPSSRDIVHYGYLLAAADCVALDATIGRLMGFGEDEVLTTLEAARRGFGAYRAEEIEIDGPYQPIRDFRLPSTVTRGRIANFVARAAIGLIVSMPRPDTNLCVRCGLCRDHCPTQAIALQPFPQISRSKCIQCYCCLEFCPYEAMRLSKRVMFIRGLASSRGR